MLFTGTCNKDIIQGWFIGFEMLNANVLHLGQLCQQLAAAYAFIETNDHIFFRLSCNPDNVRKTALQLIRKLLQTQIKGT